MILPISSNKSESASVCRHSYWCALKLNLPIGVMMTILLSLCSVLPVISYITNPYFNGTDQYRSNYHYMLLRDFGPIIYGYMVLIIACVAGITTFAFLFKKNSTNLYFSLGISRRKLFLTRYLAALTMLLLPIIITLSTNLIINLLSFGSSLALWKSFFSLLALFVISAVVGLSVSCAVCAACGTIIGAAGMLTVVMIAPTILKFCMSWFVPAFLWGNAPYHLPNTLEKLLTFINPFHYLPYTAMGIAYLPTKENDTAMSFDPIPFRVVGTILWAGIAVAAFLLAFHVFSKRRAEICGSIHCNRTLNFIATFITQALGIGMLLSFPPVRESVPLALLLCVGIVAVIAVLDLILLRFLSQDKTVRTSDVAVYPVQAGIYLAVAILLLTGGFGYTNYLPPLDSVENVTISYPGAPETFLASQYNGYTTNDKGVVEHFCNTTVTLETPDELKLIQELHREIAKAGKHSISNGQYAQQPEKYTVRFDFEVSYAMKDGTSLQRTFSGVPASFLEKLLSIDETDSFTRTQTDAYQTLILQMKDETAPYDIFLSDIYFSNPYEYNASDAEKSALIDALSQDLAAQTVQDRYFSEEKALGIVHLLGKDDFDYYYGTEPDETLPHPNWDGKAQNRIFITPAFTHTIAFLKEQGLYDRLSFHGEIDAVNIQDYNINSDLYWGGNKRQYFSENYHMYDAGSDFDITNTEEINTLLEIARSTYFATEGGKILNVHIKDREGFVTLFIPYQDLPGFVK